MLLHDINPYIRYCDIIPLPNMSSEFIKAYDCRLFYVFSGAGHFFIEDKKCEFNPSSLFLIPSGTRYRFKYSKNTQFRLFVLNFDFTQSHCFICNEMHPVTENSFNYTKLIKVEANDFFNATIAIKQIKEIESYLNEIYYEFLFKDFLYGEKASAVLKKVLYEIFIYKIKPECHKQPKVATQVMEYINQNFQNNISAESLNGYFSYHSYHLNRIFKKYTGTTIHQYLIEQRMKAAKKLLATSVMTIDEIAAAVGIESQSHFSYCFKKYMGITPSEYKKMSDSKIL